jgi:predicted PhzF superfamily epimerase YddE/YHI9
VVDVFTQTPLEGNSSTVFPDAASLDSSTMQRIARELSVSKTVFVLPSQQADCVARLKIFTPRKELDFAGSPTIGTGFCADSARIRARRDGSVFGRGERRSDPDRTRPNGAVDVVAQNAAGVRGVRMGRRSMLHVRVHGENGKDGIDVGGSVTEVIDAELCI